MEHREGWGVGADFPSAASSSSHTAFEPEGSYRH